MTKTTFLMEPKDGAFMTFSSREEVEEYTRTLREEYEKRVDAAIELLEKKPALFVASNGPVQFIEPRTLKYSDKYTKE